MSSPTHVSDYVAYKLTHENLLIPSVGSSITALSDLSKESEMKRWKSLRTSLIVCPRLLHARNLSGGVGGVARLKTTPRPPLRAVAPVATAPVNGITPRMLLNMSPMFFKGVMSSLGSGYTSWTIDPNLKEMIDEAKLTAVLRLFM